MSKEKIIQILSDTYRGATCGLVFSTPFELLVATILSAQCTDVRVNMVTPGLFEKFPDCYTMASASIADVEELIKTCGFYKNKAKNIVSASKKIVSDFGGVVPQTMDELTRQQMLLWLMLMVSQLLRLIHMYFVCQIDLALQTLMML